MVGCGWLWLIVVGCSWLVVMVVGGGYWKWRWLVGMFGGAWELLVVINCS